MVMTHSHSLIPVQQGDTLQTVNARELHAFLENRKQFSDWIKDRITKYGFVENQDFTIASLSGVANTRGGHNRVDYHISLDMAKELAMLERSDKGRQARQYFIECEKRLKEVTAVQAPTPVLPDFSNPVLSARAWADAIEAQGIAERERDSARVKVLQDAPKVAFHDAVVETEGTFTVKS